MLRRLTQHERLQLLLAEYEPVVRQAFLDAVADIRSTVTLRVFIERLERRDIQGAIEALNLDREAYAKLENAVANAFEGGGNAMAEDLRLRDPEGYRVVFRFAVRNPEAEAWLREHSATMVTRIIEDQRESIRTALTEGLSRGDNPRTTALDVVGRVNRVTGRREGGLIGLSAPHMQTVENARQAMLSGDVDGMRHYLTLKTRDRRFDASIRKAIAEGRAIPAADVARVTGRLSDKYLKLRGDTIALHETFQALSGSRNLAFVQAIRSGKVDARDVTKTWRHTPQEHPRMQHVQMQGQTVRFDQPFIAPDGTPIMHPHAEGVPANHTLGCKCRCDYRIDHTAALIRRRLN